MTGPIVRAVSIATRAQLAADRDNCPAEFTSYWRAFMQLPTMRDPHEAARRTDENVKGRAA